MIKPKGQHLLLSAFAAFVKSGGSGSLCIGGYGPEERNLKRLCGRLGLADKVFFLGQVSHPADYYPAADAYVTAATDEGMGVVIYDAMAAGLPVVGFSAGSIEEIVRPDENGWLVENRNIEALANVLFRVERETGLIDKMKSANRFKILSSYQNKDICRLYYRLYDKILRTA
jgi:glycosyltransferase involved in cell wall biosynthesis